MIGLLTAVLTYFTTDWTYAKPETMRSIAGVGVALLLAYVVEAVWMVGRAKRKEWHENWLGSLCGIGIAGMLGIVAALAVAAHREAGSGNLIDDIGLWWAVSSLGLLGGLVTLHPFIVDRWSRTNS